MEDMCRYTYVPTHYCLGWHCLHHSWRMQWAGVWVCVFVYGMYVCLCVLEVHMYACDVLFAPFQRREEEEHVKAMYVETMEQERQEAMKKEVEEVTRRKRY